MPKQITWMEVDAYVRRHSQHLTWGGLTDPEVAYAYIQQIERERDQLQREVHALQAERRRLAETPKTGKAQLRADLAALTERVDEIERRMAL